MPPTLVDAVHATAAVDSPPGGGAPSPSPSSSSAPFDAWPEHAIDACAPEGGYSPHACAQHPGVAGLRGSLRWKLS